MSRRSGLLLAILLFSVACTPSFTEAPDPHPSSGSTRIAGEDPAPVLPSGGRQVGSNGTTLRQEGVRVEVPAGAVPDGQKITVRVGGSIGRMRGAFTTELAGRPVSVDHHQPLNSALTLTWQAPQLTRQQRTSVVLARWDPGARAWNASSVKPRWSGTTLSADIKRFSVWDWFANVGQAVGSVTGSRVDAPSCNGKDLPSWVRQTVDPDEDLSAAAIRVCFEADKGDAVTVRVANNRTFTQLMTMTQSDQRWAWTWTGNGHGLNDVVVYPSAHTVLDSGTQFLLPPLSTQAVGVARPTAPGSHFIAAESTVGWESVLVDVVSYGVGELPIGGTDNPALNAFLQVMFECGGKQAADVGDAKQVTLAVVDTVGNCAREILEPESEFGSRFEALSRRAIANGGLSSTAAIQANRMAREAANLFRIIEVGKLAFYASDQFANALVQPLSWSIRGDGRQPDLGDWAATCNSYSTDSTRLYKNIALRDEFADTSKELWQYKGLPAAARSAVEPLRSCSVSYRAGLAGYLPTSWAEPKSARIVAAEMLAGLPNPTPAGLSNAFAPAMCGHPSRRMVNGQVPESSADPGVQALSTAFNNGERPVSVDLDDDGNNELVATFVCSKGGVDWPNVLGVYGPGLRILGSVDLYDYAHTEHADVQSMTDDGHGLDLRWMTYQGCCFDMQNWQGRLQMRNGKVSLTDVRRR